MATEIITLPGHLRVLFDKIYEGEPVSGNAWVVWQRVLQARTQDPWFFRRLSTVQLACRTLRQEIADLPAGTGSITPRTKNTWVEAIDQLILLTVPSDFHLQIPQWKEKARQSDITLLDTMHVFYNLHSSFLEVDIEGTKNLASEVETLSETLKASALDGRVRSFFSRILEELRFALTSVEMFGFESAWAEGINLVGAALRFRNELASSVDLQEGLSETGAHVIQFLGSVDAAKKEGGVPFTDAALALLGRAPAL